MKSCYETRRTLIELHSPGCCLSVTFLMLVNAKRKTITSEGAAEGDALGVALGEEQCIAGEALALGQLREVVSVVAGLGFFVDERVEPLVALGQVGIGAIGYP